MCRGWKEKANASAIPSKQFKFHADSLSLSLSPSLLFSLSNQIHSLCPIRLAYSFFFLYRCTTNRRSRQSAGTSRVPKVEASEFFVRSNANTIRGVGNFKQLLESSHVLLQQRTKKGREARSREFPLIPFNSTEHSMLLESRVKECNECLISPDDMIVPFFKRG